MKPFAVDRTNSLQTPYTKISYKLIKYYFPMEKYTNSMNKQFPKEGI